jgi:hypothetical protein
MFQPLRGAAQIYFGGGMSGSSSFDNDVLSVNATQSSAGGFTFQGDVDPTLTINNTVVNTSAFAWTEYDVSVTMNQSFSIDSASVSTPADWATIIGPVLPVGSNYTGMINYVAGTPVAVNGTLAFGLQITFDNSIFSFSETANPVPEPGALGFLLLGGLLLGGRMIARRQRA